MAGEQIELLPKRSSCGGRHFERQMLLARFRGRPVCVSHYRTRWDTGIGGYALMTGIARDDAFGRAAYDRRKHDSCGLIPKSSKLLQTRHVVVDHSSR